MNAKTPEGAMPANVSGSARAIVAAGFAKDVEAVNRATQPRIVTSSPNVAMPSASHCPELVRTVVENCHTGRSNLPALCARNLSLPNLFKIASAMMERAELPVQRNSTL